MRSTPRFAFIGLCAAAMAGTAAVGAWADAPLDPANQINVTFQETPAVVTDHVADLGIRQLILTSTWIFDGFGPVSDVTSVTQDAAVHPCGAGSSSESATRRIVASTGTLVLREGGIQCITASGPVFSGTYVVDGNASTGMFAAAEGSGTVTVHLAIPPRPATTTLSGRLKLADSSHAWFRYRAGGCRGRPGYHFGDKENSLMEAVSTFRNAVISRYVVAVRVLPGDGSGVTTQDADLPKLDLTGAPIGDT